jgi:hypothetical protein
MNLAETLPQKLAEWRPAGEGRHSLSLGLGNGWTMQVTADRVDSVGCLLWEVALTRSGPAGDNLPTLAAWAQSAADVRGLVETLCVIEIDPLRREALLRSAAPTKRGGQTTYYELLLHDRDRATLRRMRAPEGSRREQAPFALTHESLAQFVEGVVDS